MKICVNERVVITQMPRNKLDLFNDKKNYSTLGFDERNTLLKTSLMTIKHMQSLFLNSYTWT